MWKEAEIVLTVAVALTAPAISGCGSGSRAPVYINLYERAFFDTGTVYVAIAMVGGGIDPGTSQAGEVRAWDENGMELSGRAAIEETKLGPAVCIAVTVSDAVAAVESQALVKINGTPHNVQTRWVNSGGRWRTTSCQMDGKDIGTASPK